MRFLRTKARLSPIISLSLISFRPKSSRKISAKAIKEVIQSLGSILPR